MMRIITGTARGAKLSTLEGEATRPTSERVKEAVFSMIQFDVEGRRVLDLYAGSGQMGLEALSRGARGCVFVDSSAEAAQIVRTNAQKTHLAEKSVVLRTEATSYLRGNADREVFDIVILDPPYADSDKIDEALAALCRGNMLADGAIVICEAGTDRLPAIPEGSGLTVKKQNKYARTTFVTVLIKE